MKYLYLTKKNIFSYCAKGKRFLAFLTALCLISAYLMIYTGMAALTGTYSTVSSSSSYSNVSLVFHETPKANDILSFIDQEIFSSHLNAFLIDLSEAENNTIVIGWKGTRFTRWHALEPDKAFFLADQVESNALIAINGIRSYQSPIVTITLRGKEYDVLENMDLTCYMFIKNLELENVNDDAHVIIIPYQTFLEQGFRADVLRMDFYPELTATNTAVMNAVNRYFNKAELVAPPSVENDAYIQSDRQNYTPLFISMCVFAMVNTMILSVRLLMLERKRFAVYSFCGAVRPVLMHILASTWFFCNILSAIVSISAVYIFANVWSEWGIRMVLNWQSDVLVFLITFMLSGIVMQVTGIRITGENIRPREGVL